MMVCALQRYRNSANRRIVIRPSHLNKSRKFHGFCFYNVEPDDLQITFFHPRPRLSRKAALFCSLQKNRCIRSGNQTGIDRFQNTPVIKRFHLFREIAVSSAGNRIIPYLMPGKHFFDKTVAVLLLVDRAILIAMKDIIRGGCRHLADKVHRRRRAHRLL